MAKHAPATVFETTDHDAAGVAVARDAISSWLDTHGAGDGERDALLLVATELVTNAVCNTTGRVCVTVGEVFGGVKLQVFDESLDLPASRLAMIAALAATWGTHPAIDADHVGKVVWATCREG